MEYPVEYVNGVMITSSVFIAVAGIIITLVNRNRSATKIDRVMLGSLGLSIALGFCAIVTALQWFNTATDFQRVAALIFLLFQFILMYIPLLIVILTNIFTTKSQPKQLSPPNKSTLTPG